MSKKQYDFVFSLGFSCGTSQALRAAGLQFASYPLDWVGTPDLATSVDAIVSDFAHWVDADSMRLVDVCHGPGFGTRIYLNERTQFGFSHEFPDTRPFAESQPAVKSTYERRAARFLECYRSAKRLLAVYVEHSTHERLPDGRIGEELARLRQKNPAAEIDLVYFFEEPGCGAPSVRSERDGITVVAADYRKIENGRVTQYVDVGILAAWLHGHVVMPDLRKSEDSRKFAADMRQVASLRWGPDKSRFRRWINQRAYKLYRHLERSLQKKGLIHSEQPVWFWEHK